MTFDIKYFNHTFGVEFMKTIKSKLLMALVIPVIMVALSPIIIFIVSNINQINTAGYRSASAVLKSTTDNFDSWMSIKKNILLGYYNLDINELKSIVRSKLPINVEKVYDLYYGDVDGKTYGGLDSPEDYIAQGYDPRKRPWYIDSKAKTGEILVSEPYVDETTNDLVLTFSKAYNTTDKGVLALDISIDDIKKVVNNITLPVEGHAFLVYDEDNKINITSNDEIGELAANFNHFLDNQKKLFSEINGFLKTSTEDSIASNNEIYSRINEQQNELTAVVAALTMLEVNGIRLADYRKDIDTLRACFASNDVTGAEAWLEQHRQAGTDCC